MESRIEELTSQLNQSSRDKTETVRAHRTADRTARDAKSQLAESERLRVRLEEEVRSYDAKIVTMRQVMDDLVSNMFFGDRLDFNGRSHSKHPRVKFNLLVVEPSETLRITSRRH